MVDGMVFDYVLFCGRCDAVSFRADFDDDVRAARVQLLFMQPVRS
jgi:hypothetical protein